MKVYLPKGNSREWEDNGCVRKQKAPGIYQVDDATGADLISSGKAWPVSFDNEPIPPAPEEPAVVSEPEPEPRPEMIDLGPAIDSEVPDGTE